MYVLTLFADVEAKAAYDRLDIVSASLFEGSEVNGRIEN